MNRSRSPKQIELQGVRTHNLKSLDLKIPHGQFVGICGPSGSGKTSLAIDTLYAEGQRRYIESFSPYARQFLDQIDKPPADRLGGIPPAIAVTGRVGKFGRRATIASTVEFNSHLQLLFTRGAEIVCPDCQRVVARSDPQQVAERLAHIPDGVRIQVGFELSESAVPLDSLLATGLVRGIFDGTTRPLTEEVSRPSASERFVIVDRLSGGKIDISRAHESLVTAFQFGDDSARIWTSELVETVFPDASAVEVDGQTWYRVRLEKTWVCAECERVFAPPEPQRLSDSSPLGACPECEGLGEVSDYDPALIVPDESKSIREGAIAPWNSPAYVHEKDELLALADDYAIPTDSPWSELSLEARDRIWRGVPERKFGGLQGFFKWLERRRYKMHLRIFAARWRSFKTCPVCHGQRLRPEALAYRFGGKNVVEIEAMTIDEAHRFLETEEQKSDQTPVVASLLPRLLNQLRALQQLGLGYLRLRRPMQSLSSGEKQRVLIGRTLKTSLVNLLYVFDEPAAGLHAADAALMLSAFERLRDRNNTVVVAEQELQILAAADRVLELGPESGGQGGQIVFDGTPRALRRKTQSLTGRYWHPDWAGRSSNERRTPRKTRLILQGCRGRNLKNIDVAFPLGVLCQVMGRSGTGKTTLVRDTLFPALARHLKQETDLPLPFQQLSGTEGLSDVLLIDDAPMTRTSRSNPATFIKAYDLIRKLFAESEDGKARQLTARHFSFNVAGGRCDKCTGEGYLDVDMHFLTDLRVVCDECQGRRFRDEILKVKYRGKTIHDVLGMTSQQAFPFFRGQRKIQLALKTLLDVGLGHLPLGQPNSTLSAGEERRLKIAQFLGQNKRERSLFILLRPSVGLHPSEISRLVDCFESLLNVGHSLVIVDNHLGLAQFSDWIIELGPQGGENGGELIFSGTPESLLDQPDSPTAASLRAWRNGGVASEEEPVG